ncbi:MAG: hypothetical protein CL916_11785 [Deltaproteobacteria bacterium]|nr:hypothetical protein [Deltaproteobacteria bacterium]
MFGLIFWCGCVVSFKPVHPHIIVIVIDTLRADIVEEVDTPNLDLLAKKGQRVKKAWAPSTWTAASVISLFSGQSVMKHGWDHKMPKDMPKGESYPPFEVEQTLAEELKRNGYRTVGLFANRLLSRELGFHRGFEIWDFISDEQASHRIERELIKYPTESHFLYLHLYGAHQPLRPSPQSKEKWRIFDDDLSKKGGVGLSALKDSSRSEVYHKAYRAVVEDIDRNLGAIIESLSVLKGDKVIIVTSDHGEMLGEHKRIGHDAFVYEPLTWVPLVVYGMRPLEDPFSLVNIPFEICSTLSLDCSFTKQMEPIHSQREGEIAILDNEWNKYMYQSCFDLKVDPGEVSPKDCSKSMQKNMIALDLIQADQPLSSPEKKSFTPLRLQQLRSLGYVE